MTRDFRNVIPRLNPTCNLRALPLNPLEGFVLSQIDGIVSVSDVGLITGLGDKVEGVLQRLYALGALIADEAVPQSSPAPSTPLLPNTTRFGDTPPSHAKNAQELRTDDNDIELGAVHRQRVLEFFSRLEPLTHYEVLGVSEDASKKQIKSAYYALAPDFHPDRYFRKRLGAYKPKMEAIFARITTAYDVLTSTEARARYDTSLAQQRGTPKASPPPPIERAPDPADEPPPPRSLRDPGLRKRAFAARLSGGRFPAVSIGSPGSTNATSPDPRNTARSQQAEPAAPEKTGSPYALHRAADALLRAGGNLLQAADLAKRAIVLAPDVVEFHTTLAEVYLAVGLMRSAQQELQAAAALDGSNEKVRELLKRISKNSLWF